MSSEAVYRVLRLGFLNGYVVPVENDPYNQLRASLVGKNGSHKVIIHKTHFLDFADYLCPFEFMGIFIHNRTSMLS